MDISIVVACSSNRCIGLNNTLPWRQSADLKQFKHLTMGHPLVMGRKTYESIGKPLPGRKTIVVTRQSNWLSGHADVDVRHSLDDAFNAAKEQAQLMGVKAIMLVGGATLYEQALDIADVLHVTHIEAHIEGDAFFPVIDPVIWAKVDEVKNDKDDKNEYDYVFCRYKRQVQRA